MVDVDAHAAAYQALCACADAPYAACDIEADRFLAAELAMCVGQEAGLKARAAAELALVAAELASNAARHGGGGRLWVLARSGSLVVVCRDRGPGLRDAEAAIADGWSEGRLRNAADPPRGGLGAGLGTAARLSDWIGLYETPGGGLTVVAIRRAR